MPAIDQLQLKEIINYAVKEDASVVYFNISNYPVLEIYGHLKKLSDREILTKNFLDTIADFFLDPKKKSILTEKKELTIAYDWSDDLRLRVNFFYQKSSLSISIKLIPIKINDISELNLPKVINDIVKLNSGLVIVCGPVSSGRSITISAILDYINKNKDKRIITIENPIEHRFINDKSIIEQREIGHDVDSMENALNDLIDESFDIVYLSRVDNALEIRSMLQVADSGKLVFAIFDISSISTLLNKLYGSFETSEKDWARSLITENLKVVINQRLVPKSGGGQILIPEVFTTNSAGKSIVKSAKFDQLQSIIQTSRGDNMQSLNNTLEEFTRRGIIKAEDAENYYE
ncbi:Flp pilus assembly complex ATPase component TadA [bacterium]|nr:Flp pilus assembly complex ATPase component TadA [bacterium]